MLRWRINENLCAPSLPTCRQRSAHSVNPGSHLGNLVFPTGTKGYVCQNFCNDGRTVSGWVRIACSLRFCDLILALQLRCFVPQVRAPIRSQIKAKVFGKRKRPVVPVWKTQCLQSTASLRCHHQIPDKRNRLRKPTGLAGCSLQFPPTDRL